MALSVASAFALFVTGRTAFMNGTMGFFLLFLSALQLFDLHGFADSFARYDLLAARSRLYALAYPFIEAVLGIAYLAHFWPLATNLVALSIFLAGAAGVVRIIRSGEKLTCACVGTGFALPVGKVTLLEDAAMAGMAALNLLLYFR